MAKLPLNVHLTSHPSYLSIRGPLVYEDENQRTWLYVVMDIGGHLQVQLCQTDYPSGHIALTTNPTTMPSMWMLHTRSQYLDSMGRFWRIVHHIKEDDMEEMVLELMDDS